MPSATVDIDNTTGTAIVTVLLTEGDRVLACVSQDVPRGETGLIELPNDLEELRKDGTWGQ